MRRIAGTALVLLLVGCGGDGGNGPGDANVEGNWIITFTSSGSCTLSQIGLILLADGTTPSEGSYGSYAVTCTGQQPTGVPAGAIAAYQVSGKNVSIQFSNVANNQKTMTGTVSGATISGNFSWNASAPAYSISGSFVAAKQ